MKYDPQKHHRRSMRLNGYDYAQPGAYFITVVTQHRACLFGDIINGEARLNNAGRMVERWWFELKHKFPTIETDKFVIMPNHFHGIVVIAVGADLRVGPHPEGTHSARQGTHIGVPLPGLHPTRRATRRDAPTGAPESGLSCAPASAGVPLPTVVQWFKTMTTNEYMRGIKTLRWVPFRGRLWQRNYYEHIIRGEESLSGVREYILNNPAQWAFDHENPAATAPEQDNPWRTPPT